MDKQRRFQKYSVGIHEAGAQTKVNVDDMTRDQILDYLRIGLKDLVRSSDESLSELIRSYKIDLNDMPDEMLREIIKDYADACDDRLKAAI